ncbi:SusC/RagA family TonB-linked outer membrane protein [Pedobacter sp. L105]|uniref:SusC/RagA family TonB-linked outer membrane protein n=1 Tax=Pedobacter sp. L105 TaxID=1641871 RepID=UPI00131AA1FF|nr:SusC/RagA family TonB-linked outer membrane protein [Pedobacter sp. L105]
MKRKLLAFLCVLMFIGSYTYAQTRTITGKVTGKEDGLPLPGVSVAVKGTKTVAQTGADGTYTIKIPRGQSLVFSFIGFTSQTLIPERGYLDVVLEGSASLLNDVVVIGYGTQVRRDNIGSIGSVKGSDVAQQPVQNIQQSLGGRVSGAQVSLPSGLLNATPVIRIRGTNSISYSSQPLFVVDGVPSYSADVSSGTAAAASPLSSINPDDIESVDIAKDASATAIYGSRAANGVVFITTKKGKLGKPVVTLESWVGVSKNFNLPKMLDAEQYTMIKNEGLKNAGTFNNDPANPSANVYYATSKDASGNVINTNWLDYIYRTGTSYNTSASISGANENTSYYFSANYSDQEGLLVRNEFQRKVMLANVDHKINKYVTVGAKINFADSRNLSAIGSGSMGDAFSTAGLGRIGLVLPPNVSPKNVDGSYNLNGNAVGLGANKGIGISYYNILPIVDLNRSNNELSQVSSNVYLQVKPVSWITFKTQYGIDYLDNDMDIYQNPIQGDANPNGEAIAGYTKNQSWVWDNTLQFDHTFAEKHNFSLLLGNEQNRFTSKGFGIDRTVISDPAFDVVQAGYSTNAPTNMVYEENYISSFFGRLNYDFDKKYYLSATLRRDEASQFGLNNKRGYFPGGAVAWQVAREKFWNDIDADKIFSSFKLRSSYGKVGNNGLGSYDSYGLYSTSLYNGAGTLVFNQTGNSALKWENIKTLDVGASFGVLNDRITADVTYYKKNIDDLILQVPVAPSSGLPSNPSVNIGSMYNRGWELTLSAAAIQSRDFSWTPSFNLAFNHNEVTALANGITRLTTSTGGLETTNITEIGHPIGDLYIVRTVGVDPATGRRIFLNQAGREVLYQKVPPANGFQWEYTDGTQAPAITQSADAVNYKQSAPKIYGGFSNTFRYKSFDLNVMLTYQLGGWTYYGTNAGLLDQRFWNNSVDILDRWTTPGQVTDIPRVVAGDNVSNGSSLPLSSNVFRSDFLKVKSINVGYTLPKRISNSIGLSNLRVYLTGYNLFTITGYPGPDPEVSSNGAGSSTGQGIDRNTAGNQRTVTAGLSVKF